MGKKDKRANILYKELDSSSSPEYLITPLARQEAMSLQLSTGDGLDLLETQQKRDILCLDWAAQIGREGDGAIFHITIIVC